MILAAFMILEVTDKGVKKRVTDKYLIRRWNLISRKWMLLLQYLSDWCLHIAYVWHKFWGKTSQIEWLFESNLRFFGYFECSKALWLFLWTPVPKATCLQELAVCFRSRLSPDPQNRAFAKNESYIQILDRTLQIFTFIYIYIYIYI